MRNVFKKNILLMAHSLQTKWMGFKSFMKLSKYPAYYKKVNPQAMIVPLQQDS